MLPVVFPFRPRPREEEEVYVGAKIQKLQEFGEIQKKSLGNP